jgi:hypothetical protein
MANAICIVLNADGTPTEAAKGSPSSVKRDVEEVCIDPAALKIVSRTHLRMSEQEIGKEIETAKKRIEEFRAEKADTKRDITGSAPLLYEPTIGPPIDWRGMILDGPKISPAVEEIIKRASIGAAGGQIDTQKHPVPFPRPESQHRNDEKK